MRLSALLGHACAPDPEITSLTLDSRKVVAGSLFAAFAGSATDGARFVADALTKGAVAILSADAVAVPADVALVVDADPRARMAALAARFFAPQPRVAVAITGTNGKTSVAWFVRQLWAACGHPAASIGTLGVVTDAGTVSLGMTTPDTVTLHTTLQGLAQRGIDHVALEASSHGLDQRRLDGVDLAAVAFTNFTQDHLDYHITMDAYRNAKLRLFAERAAPGTLAVVCADGAGADDFMAAARARGLRLLTTGRAGADLVLQDHSLVPDGQRMTLHWAGHAYDVVLPLAGAFQADNALVAAGIVLGLGGDVDAVMGALARLVPPPGRMQGVGRGVYVDYAHTPDGLERVLCDLRAHTQGRLHVVFGCGGDRDAGKRPLMGAIAARLADAVIVTDDNPRSENPEAIRAAILATCPNGLEIADRADAIRVAITNAQPGDVVLIAGKGHEVGQTYGDRTLPFDDVAVSQGILEREQVQV
jgi:UDP-N-acetylmuramoyl-L-alanyl-D-glutamate--2,6-diaminopimelate ligase